MQPLKNGCRTFPSADFARYSISARSFGSTQMPLCPIRRANACVFRTSGSRHLPKVCGRGLVEAVVDLAGVDEVASLAAADVEPVPFRAVQRDAGDGQGLPLRAGLLDPVVAAARRVDAFADFGYDAFQTDLSGVREQLAA
jgi:hypothetical protein